GHRVIGVDIDSRKVESIANGRAPFFEPELETLLLEARQRNLLSATTDEVQAIAATALALICVGTPSERKGGVNLGYLRSVLGSIGCALRDLGKPFIVVLRSTVLPHLVD